MSNPLLIKLLSVLDLACEDQAALARLTDRRRSLNAREHLIREGEAPTRIHLVVDGFACRCKMLPEGRRQIVAILAPGDFCDLQVAIVGRLDHSVVTLTPCVVADVDRDLIMEIIATRPGLARALWWMTLVEEATLREWLVNMGQRSTDRRLAHLLCELLTRLQAVGRAGDNAFELPLTQQDLADTLGISPVHVNRVLQQLRADGLIGLAGRLVEVPDVERFKAFAGFDAHYLRLGAARAPSASQMDVASSPPPGGAG